MDRSNFSSWELDSNISSAIAELGWTEPTEIQLEAIPVARRGIDVVGQARTGSGKTAAFGIPIIERCEPSGETQALVLCPTRELAVQVAEEVAALQGGKGLSVVTVYGGTDIEKQAKTLGDGADIIVGTPGRVIDMSKRGHIKLSNISCFCLDEADRMLDMGFFPDVNWVVERMDGRKHTMLFSATFPQEVLDAAEEFTNDPVHVMSEDLEVEVPEIDQFAIKIGRLNKMWALGRIIANMAEGDQMLIFTNTKRMVDMLDERLNRHGVNSASLHGDMAQNKRERILDGFREGGKEILVATDVAARGLDVDGITHVVNYDLPDEVESYVHRIGRTGRMGRSGQAWSFVTSGEQGMLEKIANTWNMEIPLSEPPGLPEGAKEMVKQKEDWDELSDIFGMVTVRLSVGGSDATKLTLAEWVLREARVPEIAIGEISLGDQESTIEVHVKKASYVIDVLKTREFMGRKLKPSIVK
ncbi:MAG: DEAD/DEAH box helicase [Candidatus Thalassarchaeaceae archaeon]|jgi:ATP-dependent RNA helicase DeaD|nr:DEAD/DEAH box helicase [Candidatus Thalassarchaeaceae archaeon]